MSNQTQRLKFTQLAASIALVAGGAAFVPTANAAAPTAGTNISNIASASYTDSTGNSKTVTSNVVTTTVLQVASFTLVSDQTKTANANGQVSLSHTLTNTGNGSDTFNLGVVNDDTRDSTVDSYDFTGLNVYLDANKDGIPDSQTPVTAITLAAGESVNLIVQATTASTNVTAGDLGKLTVSAISGFDTSITAKNVDTVKITNGAVISLVKSASVKNVDATLASTTAREVEYSLAYQNTGNTTATDVTITDILPAGLTYVNGSATVNGTALTDGVDADKYNVTGGVVTLVVPTVVANSGGVLKFKVRVDLNMPAGTITNTAEVDPDGPGTEGKTPSNSNDITVLSVKKGTINDSTTDVFADGVTPKEAAPVDDRITKSTTQGTPVIFGGMGTGVEPIVIHNTGNVTEAFNLIVNKNTLPPGSIVELFKADGVTPLTDTNGDGIVDTGPITSGTTTTPYQVVAKVTLPSGYSTASAINTILTSVPVTNPTAKDTITLVIDKVTASTVDLHNGDGADSKGSVSGASGQDTGQYVETKSAQPGVAVNFPLTIENKGATGDNFNLSTAPALPTGWTVQYYLADGSGNPIGAAITNTGNIPAAGTVNFVAVVTSPASAPVGDQEVIFKVASPATGLTDVMSDRVTVETNRVLSLQNDRTGQIAPGGTIVYKHTLTNNGNLVEGATTGSLPYTITNDQAANGWVTSLFVDLNNDGIADANELVTGNDLGALAIARGAAVNLLIKVQAPTNATAGTPSSVVFSILPTVVGGQSVVSLVNTDLTTVTNGQVRLVKEQSLANCSSGAATGTYTQNTVSAKPGECVKYRITATNEGNADVTNVVISDATPAYTTLKVIANASPVATNATLNTSTTALTDGSTGTIAAEKTPLAPSTSAVLEFVIKVNN